MSGRTLKMRTDNKMDAASETALLTVASVIHSARSGHGLPTEFWKLARPRTMAALFDREII